MECIQCNNITINPKFCSKSCAVKYNNQVNPKRKLNKKCKRCNEFIPSNRVYCKPCSPFKSQKLKETLTLKEVKRKGTSNFNSTYPYIRTSSRRAYLKSNKPQYCIVCKYTLHFDVCHIKAINSYIESDLIKDINNLDNLVALCKNHHWEYDNGHLDLMLFL